MNTRLTVDLHNEQLIKLLRLEAAHGGRGLGEIIAEALQGYFSSKKENRAVMKLAEKAFAEWDNPKDAVYDRL